MWNHFQIQITCRDISGVTSDCPCVWCRRLTICFLRDVWLCKGSLNNRLDCLHLRQWQVTFLMTLYDWTMSCQPGPPRVRHGQWPRWQQRPVGYTFPYKMANFHGVYLKFGRIDSANFLYDKIRRVFLLATNSRSDTTILQWVKKDPATIFTCIRERHLWQCHDV